MKLDLGPSLSTLSIWIDLGTFYIWQHATISALQFHHVGLGRLSEVFIFIKGLMKGSLKKQLYGGHMPYNPPEISHLLGAAIELLQVTHH